MIDISWPLKVGMTSYKNRHPLLIESLRTVAAHGVADSRCVALHMHAGTHIDAPSHFIAGGATIEQLSLTQMNGRCRVLDLTNVSLVITKADLVSWGVRAGERILLKTKNSFNDADALYNQSEVYLGHCAADYLARCGVALVGIDALGLERDQPGHPSHRALFNAGVVIVEGLRLAHVYADVSYVLHLFPLSFIGTEAAPARAVLELEKNDSSGLSG